jgi:AAA domain
MQVYRLSDVRKYVSDHPLPEPFIGEGKEALIGAGMNINVYGPAGGAKTTLMLDMAEKLTLGRDWLGFPVPRVCRVMFIEAEGSRDHFFAKVNRKFGAQVNENLFFRHGFGSLREDAARYELAYLIQFLRLDLVILGPVTALGFDQAGTHAETREFIGLLGSAPSPTTMMPTG